MSIVLCSDSSIKKDAVNLMVKTMESYTKSKIVVRTVSDVSDFQLDQPINEGTAFSCLSRLFSVFVSENSDLKSNDSIISIENGLYVDHENKKCHDVCVVMVGTVKNSKLHVKRYNSFGIPVDYELFKLYTQVVGKVQTLSSNDLKALFASFYKSAPLIDADCDNFQDLFDGIVHTDGYRDCSTFGMFLKDHFGVEHNNWMKDSRFGNIDRVKQISDALNKYLVDVNTDIIPDFPKQGVMFKHMTSVLVKPQVLDTMYKSLERFIVDNFNLDEIDYFAGLDARGFYLAPVLARVFGKGFIPVRKAGKLPKTTEIVSQNYTTEYSADEFALENRAEYRDNDDRKKSVLILDDLLATGGSVIGAFKLLTKVGLNVVGAVTVYDVKNLRFKAKEKMNEAGIVCKVLLNDDNIPDDFAKQSYVHPEIVYDRIRFDLEHQDPIYKADEQTDFKNRFITLNDDNWIDSESNESEFFGDLKMNGVKMICTKKDRKLGNAVLKILCKYAKIDSSDDFKADVTSEFFGNGESRVKIDGSVRGKHVIIVSQIRTGSINNDLMELLLIMDACSRASVDKVSVVMPYYPYSRSDKKDDPRCPIGAAVVAKLLKSLNIDNLISLDLHAGQIQGFMDKGIHNLYMKKYICDYIFNKYLKMYPTTEWNEKFILVAPDAGSAKAVKDYSKFLGINNIVLDKDRDYSKPGTVMNSRMIGSKKDIAGKIAIVIDDMADTMGTLCSASKELVSNGLKYVVIIVTHGIFSGEALNRLNSTDCIKEMAVSDSLPQSDNLKKCPKLSVFSCDELIARAVDGILTGRSISRLF